MALRLVVPCCRPLLPAAAARARPLLPTLLAARHARPLSSAAAGARAAIAEDVDTVLLDCDGVLWNGDTIIEGVPETLDSFRQAGKRLLFITNNSTKSRAMAAAKFERLGIQGVGAEDIITSGFAAAKYLQSLSFHENTSGCGNCAMVVVRPLPSCPLRPGHPYSVF